MAVGDAYTKATTQAIKEQTNFLKDEAISGETANSIADYVKDQIYTNNVKYLVETATSSPTSNSMAHRIEAIQTFTGNTWVTIQIYLGEGSSQTISLSGISGTVKSAFVMANVAISFDNHWATSRVSSLVWEGNTIATDDVVAKYTGTADYAGGVGRGAACYDVTSYITMNDTNTYTLNYDYEKEGGAGGTPSNYNHGGILVLTYEPSTS